MTLSKSGEVQQGWGGPRLPWKEARARWLGRGWIPRKRIGVATAPRKTREAREDSGWLWLIPMGIERVAARWNKKPRF